MLKRFRKWLYYLLFVPATVQTVTMTEEEWEKEKAERRFQEEKKYQLTEEEGETDEG